MSAPLHVFGAFGPVGSGVVGVAIGVAFGWFLERGGLGDARKLSGQFYLTDLTVFKVLFTALVTAMLGVFWLARLGILEPRLLDAPPTFVVPMLAGGAVFGVGFLLGGLCPGTSCVSASSGRVDGMLVVAGMFLGVLAFMELHPLLEAFHNGTDRGVLTLPALLGLRPGIVVAGVGTAALLAFAVADRIDGAPRASRARRPLVAGALVLSVGAALPLGDAPAWTGAPPAPADRMASDTLARALRAGDADVRVLDVRPADAFRDFHLPRAESAPFAALTGMELDPRRPVLVYGFGSTDGARAQVLLSRLGLERVRFLDGGAVAWLRTVMLPRLPADPTPEERRRFEALAELSRYFGGTPGFASESEGAAELDLSRILGEARRASCGW